MPCFFLILFSLLGVLHAKNDKPNFLLILADDLGWSDIAPYGGEIQTPNLDRLAEEGVRTREFYNGARCCPTRAALLTGVYPHQAGMGWMVSSDNNRKPGSYQGYLSQSTVTLAEVLKSAGYKTLLSGKWHVGEKRPNWPIDRGFDHHYGLISGAMNYFDIEKTRDPKLRRTFVDDDQEIRPPADSDFYTTDAFTDRALLMLEQVPAEQPFFLYLAYNAPHWPLQAPEEIIQKYEPLYQKGWDKIRKERIQRQIEMGLLDKDTPLPKGEEPPWEELSKEEQSTMTRKLATYAAMVDRMDWNIGRVLEQLENSGRLDNTFIVFLSDNGASAEKGLLGHNFRPDFKGKIGTADSYHSYGISGASISDTPLRKYKANTHEGGIRTPCIIRWPAATKNKAGEFLQGVGHIIDFMPTFCELAGVDYPTEFRGRPIPPMEGQSLVPLLEGKGQAVRELGWEHQGAAAWRKGDWKIVRFKPENSWELYDLAKDPNETKDLAFENPAQVRELSQSWQEWAKRIGVSRKFRN